MIEAIVKINVDTVLPNKTRIFCGVRGDSGTRFIDVRLTVSGEPINAMGGNPTINFKRPDGAEASFSGSINEDGTLRLPVAKWALEIPGEVICSATMTNGDLRLSTTEFYVMAQAFLVGSGDDPEEDNPSAPEVTYVGVADVTQTKESTESGGENIWTVTLTDGSQTDFVVRNGMRGEKGEKGERGEAGKNGANGYTPVKGTDYWTEADKSEIKSYVDNAILGGEW